jgi:hypothetical protein
LDDDTGAQLLERVRKASIALKRQLSSEELFYLYKDLVNGVNTFDE